MPGVDPFQWQPIVPDLYREAATFMPGSSALLIISDNAGVSLGQLGIGNDIGAPVTIRNNSASTLEIPPRRDPLNCFNNVRLPGDRA